MPESSGKWRCLRSGACCRAVDEVVMTHAERSALETAAPPPTVRLAWAPHADSRFVRLLTPGGCPLLAFEDGLAVCTVHAVRPYNCRRWMCGRETVEEPVDLAPVPLRVLRSRDLRRQYAVTQRKAQRWARAHGWPCDAQ